MACTDDLGPPGDGRQKREAAKFPGLVVGCCTALLERPFFARLNVLQVASQTMPPDFHSLVASGPLFDRRLLDDLMGETTLFSCIPQPATTLACYALGLEELHARGVNLFFCLDHDCVYKRGYIESVCNFVKSSGLDLQEGMFCLNLVDQQWITLYDDARADVEQRSFRGGLGPAPGDKDQLTLGAPPTFVFGRGAAKAIMDHVRKGAHAPNGYHDQPWRQALAAAGIQVTQVQTPEPVFAYVRHTNNLCWGGKPVGLRQEKPDGPTRILPARPRPAKPAAHKANGAIDVSVIVPTYNEGVWLNNTVESVRDADNDLRCEIIVVDDGCNDGSVERIDRGDDLRVVRTSGEQLGLIVAKNVGAKAARGKYLCFVDSHMVVHHHWLDYLRETCDTYPEGCLVSGNLPDVARFLTPDQPDRLQYGYIIRNCLLGTGWHFYGNGKTDRSYLEPLTPGGLMFTQKAHFARLGGFAPCLRKWGSEDIQISLQNYYVGGENVVDPRVVIYHYYKNGHTNRRTFSVTNAQSGFNSLYVAAAYFPPDYYRAVRETFMARPEGPSLVAEIESGAIQDGLQKKQSDFVRGFDDWTTKFHIELRKFFTDVEQRSAPVAAPCAQSA